MDNNKKDSVSIDASNINIESAGAKHIKRLGINWRFILFTSLLVFVGGSGTVYGLINSTISHNTWLLTFVYFILTELSITMGYHRLFSHKSYSAHWVIRLILLLLASATFQQNVIAWCSEHREHHQFSDTPLDPYNIQQGFFYAHIGWLLHHYERKKNNISDLRRDPLVRWQEKYWVTIGIIVGFVLPTIIAGFWHDALNGFIVAGLFRTLFVWQCTFSVNSFAHFFGKKNYIGENLSKDSWLVALITFGEGYHDYHHAFPYDYRNGVKWYHFDPSKWVIRLLAVIGLAKGLKQAPEEKIAAKKTKV